MTHDPWSGRRQVLPLLESDLQASIVEGVALLDTRERLSKCTLERGQGMERVWYLD